MPAEFKLLGTLIKKCHLYTTSESWSWYFSEKFLEFQRSTQQLSTLNYSTLGGGSKRNATHGHRTWTVVVNKYNHAHTPDHTAHASHFTPLMILKWILIDVEERRQLKRLIRLRFLQRLQDISRRRAEVWEFSSSWNLRFSGFTVNEFNWSQSH
jgi:hypothetical protein